MKLEKIKARGCEGLYRDLDSNDGNIYFRKFRKGKKELKRSLFTTEIEEAKRERDKIWAGYLAGQVRLKKLARQSKMAIDHFDECIKRKEAMNPAEKTMNSIKLSRANFKPFLSSMLPHEVTAAWWESVYIPEMRKKKAKRKFFNDRKWLLWALRQWRRDGIIDKAPELVKPDAKTTVGKVYTTEQVNDMINFAPTEDLHLMILMASTMGMRKGEILGLKVAQIDIELRQIQLFEQDVKTRVGRTFFISEACWPLLLKRTKTGSPWVFPSAEDLAARVHSTGFNQSWRWLKNYLATEIYKKPFNGRFHDLRHTFLTRACNAPGANIGQISTYSGVSIATLQKVYLHLTPEDSKRVAELVKYE